MSQRRKKEPLSIGDYKTLHCRGHKSLAIKLFILKVVKNMPISTIKEVNNQKNNLQLNSNTFTAFVTGKNQPT
jgi:hypothetical protein